MSVNFNSAAMGAFRNVNLGGADSIANLDGKGGVKKNGESGNFIGKMFRASGTKDNNNAARTALLKSLGQAFGLAGMTVKDGKTTFSREFMDKLEQLLGPAFKRADFKIGADGSVTSGKPLTQRRITAILGAAKLFATDGFSVAAYKEKLAAMKAELGSKVPKVIGDVEASLDFLEKVGDKFVRNHPTYDFYRNDLNDEKGAAAIKERFQYYDEETKDYKTLTSVKEINDFLFHRLACKGSGELLHLELVRFDPKAAEDIKPLKDYINSYVKSFVTKMIDTWFAAKAAGKLPEFRKHLENPGACMEEKIKQLIEFNDKHLTDKSNAPSAKEAAEIQRAANEDVGPQAKPRTADKVIFDELNVIFANPETADLEKWKDIGPLLKKNLVGKTSEIVRAVEKGKGNWSFESVKENGKPVVRPLTAEDIDALGPICNTIVTGNVEDDPDEK